MIMVSVALVMAVIVTNIYLRKDCNKRVPAFVRAMFLRSVSRKISLTNKVTMAENHVHEANSRPQHNTLVPDIELDNLSILSEIETLTHPHQTANRRKSTFSRSAGPAPHRYHDSHEVNHLDPIETIERFSYEWQKLAQIIDRAFFWLFLLASVAALTSMFAVVPQYMAT